MGRSGWIVRWRLRGRLVQRSLALARNTEIPTQIGDGVTTNRPSCLLWEFFAMVLSLRAN